MKIYKLYIYTAKLYVYIAEFDDDTVMAEIYKIGNYRCNGTRYASSFHSLIRALGDEFKTEINTDTLTLRAHYN